MDVLMGEYFHYINFPNLVKILCRFSRKLVWLELTPTNHDPTVVSRFYLESVEAVAGKNNYLNCF